MTSLIITSLVAIPLAVGSGFADRAKHPYWLFSSTQQDKPISISQRFKLAKKGDPASQLIVGLKYLELQNTAQALYWFEKSAAQGNAEAQMQLGDAYARGKGVSLDYITAHMWLSRAAAKGTYEAKYRFEYLLSKMTPEQIAKAQRAALRRTLQVE